MLIALTPFRYGKGSEHWNFAKNDPIEDGVIADKDLCALKDRGIIKVDKTKAVTDAKTVDISEPKDNKIKDSGYGNYLQESTAIAKELISCENSVPKLLFAKSVEEKESSPKRKKIVCDAIKRRVFEITGKRIP